jgi:predicted nucleic acid-binding protein
LRIVIDTNVIAYLLFGEQAVAEESAALVLTKFPEIAERPRDLVD